MLQGIQVTNSEAVFIHCICASFKSSQYFIHIELFNPNCIVTRIIRESKHDENIHRVKYIVAKLRICNLLFHLHAGHMNHGGIQRQFKLITIHSVSREASFQPFFLPAVIIPFEISPQRRALADS